MASIPRCWIPPEHASVSFSQLASLHFSNLPRVQQVRGRRAQRRLQVRCSIQDEKVNLTKSQDLDLPLQSQQNMDEPLGEVRPEEDVKETLNAAREKFDRTTVTKAFQQAKQELRKQGVAKLSLFGGAAVVGIILSGAVLKSLEVIPLVPEAMQAVGLAYSVVVASRVIRGAPEKFKVSPIRAVLEIVEEGGKMTKQRTSLVMPQDLDKVTIAAMERLARERDLAVNQVEEMKRRTAEYSQILSEKEALETVALQLAEERETALAEVSTLKSAVESMSERMKGIEALLEQEVGQLKSQNQALETVALQLAQEHNVALEETASLQARSQSEKQALEEVATQLARERDEALTEVDRLRTELLAKTGSSSSTSSDSTAQLQQEDGHMETPQHDISSLIVSHIVDEFEVQSPG